MAPRLIARPFAARARWEASTPEMAPKVDRDLARTPKPHGHPIREFLPLFKGQRCRAPASSTRRCRVCDAEDPAGV